MYRQITYKGKQLHYQCVGQGAAVVLVHGFGEDSSVWKAQMEFLQHHFQVLLPDLPGSGRSEPVEDMSMEGLANAVKCMMEAEGLESGVLIGHSMGGYITLAFAEKYGERLKGFGLFHSSAYADTEEKKTTRRKGIAFIKEQGAYPFLKTAIPNLYSPATKERHPTLIEEQLHAVKDFSGDALCAYYEAMMQRPDRTEVLRQSLVPVMFVLGRWDTAVLLADGLEQCRLPKIAYIDVLEESGHMGMAEETEQSNAFLNRYLSDIYHR
jgi:pimeloyl-ACP methyl ester carboxylesterase